MKAQRAEDVMSNYCKNELDLGIQESIRRCEALLAMVPSSFQPILIDGVLRSARVTKKEAAQSEYETKLDALDPEWSKNMGLLSNNKYCNISNTTVEHFETPSSETTPSSQDPLSQTPNLSSAQNLAPIGDQHVDYINMQGGVRSSRDENFHKRIYIKRHCARSCELSSGSEDWTDDFSLAAETTTTTSVSGIQDDRSSLEEAKEVSDKIQRTSDSSEKMPSSGTDESSGSRKNMETKNVCNGRVPLEDASQQTTVTSTTPTTIPTEDGYVEEVDTKKYASSMNSDRSSRSSCQSFETLCFTFTTPQHCEEAWEWFDQTTRPDAKYKGNVVHGGLHSPRRGKQLKHFMTSQWSPDGKVLERMHLTLKAPENAARLKPRGSTTNFRRNNTLANERQDRANPDLVRTQRVDKGDGKTKSHVAAMVESQRENARILKFNSSIICSLF